mmetsp:Transcript_28748/g.72352  ORF Transcript_28748/g.72352 Transcript_28748/m.72352 type:complete len:256 (+) Transcript_28748:322-1089(+)
MRQCHRLAPRVILGEIPANLSNRRASVLLVVVANTGIRHPVLGHRSVQSRDPADSRELRIVGHLLLALDHLRIRQPVCPNHVNRQSRHSLQELKLLPLEPILHQLYPNAPELDLVGEHARPQRVVVCVEPLDELPEAPYRYDSLREGVEVSPDLLVALKVRLAKHKGALQREEVVEEHRDEEVEQHVVSNQIKYIKVHQAPHLRAAVSEKVIRVRHPPPPHLFDGHGGAGAEGRLDAAIPHHSLPILARQHPQEQ